jgi:peptidoglycan/LPS O-acetylase OafA/YrhL
VLFYDFPPWPWLSLVLLGLVLGWAWLGVHRQRPAAAARWLGAAAAIGALMVLAFIVYDRWADTPMRFGMRRDFILNHHWTPRPVALLWVLGMVLLMLAAAYWVMEQRRLRLPWLVLLGQTALALYFIHQVIAHTLVKEWLGWRFNTWPGFWLATGVFTLLVGGCGWAWRELRDRVGRAYRPALAPPG